MKKLFFGAFAVAVALGASAFTNVKDIAKTFAAVTYYNVGSGVYQLTPPSGSCTTSDPNKCTIEFTNPNNVEEPAQSFDLDVPASIPTNLGSRTSLGASSRY